MTALAEVLPPEPSLAELAETANREHRKLVQSARSMFEAIITAGEALLEAKRQVKPGTWQAWLGENFEGTIATADGYMRIATHRDLIQGGDGLSVNEALRQLKGLPMRVMLTSGAPVSELRDDALELHGRGISGLQIARLLGVHHNTVYKWVNPESAERHRRDKARRARERRAEKALRAEAERERKIKRAAKKAGGAMAEAYSLVSRLDQVLGQAREEANTNEARRAIGEMHALRNKMMDQAVRALGVS